ncbi:MAG TPA: protein kinase [Polyangiaceae bacterium]|nr:protein kinase [Polyangiaceae bacterium]
MGEEQIPKELVAGKYRLTRLLGRGGMGSVWEGVHNTLGTRVACKFIETEYADSDEARSRFENEARAAASLRSKHVVEVYDHGVAADGRPYIVMEFLQGEPLDKRLERSGRLTVAEAASVITHVARALSKAHSAGIVHRDLKPENIFLVWDDEDSEDIAKVVDFGIAKFTDKSNVISSSTRTGSVLGTPYYMSPEQARGLRTVDYRSDLWSLGVITFRCVTGRLPFEGEALGDLLVKLCTAPVPLPSQLLPGLPPAFDAWMARALSRDPEGRFPDARAMAQALAQIAAGASGVGVHVDSGVRAHVPSGVFTPGPGSHGGFQTPPGQGGMAQAGMGTPQPHSGGFTPQPHSGGFTPQPGLQRASTPQPGSGTLTPQPGMLTPGFGLHALQGSADPYGAPNNTNAALSATPPLPLRSSKVPWFAGAIAAVAVLGIGGFVLARSLGASAPSESTASAAPPSAPAIADKAPEPVAAPAVEPAPEPVALEDLGDPVEPAEPAPAKKPAVAQKPRRPAASAPKSVAPAAAPPPQPAPAPEPELPKPVVAKPVRKKPGIDVGY